MNIIYISASAIPSRYANSVHVMRMCQAFGIQGHTTTLIAQSVGNTSMDAIFNQYGVEPVFDLATLPRKGPGAIGALEYTIRVRKAVRSLPVPDVFYSRYIHGALSVASEGVPLVYEAHGPPRGRFERWQFETMFRSASFARLVVISNALQEIFIESFPSLDTRDVIVAHDGADLPRPATDSPDAATTYRDDRLTVGYIGSLYEGRGLELIGEVARNCPNIDFDIVGGAPQEVSRWRQRIPHTNVRWHGHVTHSHLQKYFDKIDVLLAPYQRRVGIANNRTDTSRYMSPLKIFEYMAQGKAIVASDLPVLREVLVNERHALLCEPEDVQAWTNALHRLAKGPELRLRLGGSAQELLRDRYTWGARAEAVIAAPWSRSIL
jgi:glycosyltransferase involved in cell wall biosynthesis